VTPVVGALAVLVAAFVKGAIAFGFPTIATPLFALVVDVKTAVAILIVPNLAMDLLQSTRRPGLVGTLRRHAVLYGAGIAGTFAGTYWLHRLSDRHAMLVLGAFVLAFVALNVSRLPIRVPPSWERRLAAPAGLLAGVVGGITNAHGTPLVVYFYALGLDKGEFVRAISLAFIVYKTAQLAAVIQTGMMTLDLFWWSIAATLGALAAFRLGLVVQDRLNQRAFNRAILGMLAALGALLVYRALR
jgi:uncharacterized membrane protein YfcA